MELTKREIELVLEEMKKDRELNTAVHRAYLENELLFIDTGSYHIYQPVSVSDYLEWNGKGIELVNEFLKEVKENDPIEQALIEFNKANPDKEDFSDYVEKVVIRYLEINDIDTLENRALLNKLLEK